MNVAALRALQSKHDVNYVGPVNPPVGFSAKALSKALKLVGRPRDFAFFSQTRLKAIAREVHHKCSKNADLDFFHGFTPWILTEPQRPFVTWSDCTFADYIEFFHDRTGFRSADLTRIERTEAAWLKYARRIGFSSRWAADRAVNRYGLDRARVRVVGIFGDLDPPERDLYSGGRQLAFISTNFARKGGHEVLAAFGEVRKMDPCASLIVVGDVAGAALGKPGVTYAGFLRKENPAEYARLRAIFASSRVIVNASRSDTAPVLLVEAGYFGCPVISTCRFAIPEIVEHGRTGLLLDEPADAAAIAEAMKRMLSADDDYLAMRKAAWQHTRDLHSKSRFAERLLDCIEAAA